MVLGQDEAIDEGVRRDFRDSGLAHLLAVSGQNVMLLAALAQPLLAAAGLGPRGRGIALLLLIAVYMRRSRARDRRSSARGSWAPRASRR